MGIRRMVGRGAESLSLWPWCDRRHSGDGAFWRIGWTHGAGGNRVDASSQTMNGNTYYGDYYDDAYSDAMDATSGDDSIPEEVKDIIAGYYEGIEN